MPDVYRNPIPVPCEPAGPTLAVGFVETLVELARAEREVLVTVAGVALAERCAALAERDAALAERDALRDCLAALILKPELVAA